MTKRNTTKRNAKREPETPAPVHPFACLDAGALRSWEWINPETQQHRAMAKAWCAPRCQYVNARGGPCRMPAVKGKRRCCYHGGGRSKRAGEQPTARERLARNRSAALPWALLAAVPWLDTFKAGWAIAQWRKRSIRDAFLQGDRERLMRELGEAREAARPILLKHGHDPNSIL